MITATVEANPHLTVEEIQSITGVSHGSVVIHLHKAGFVNRKNVWLPHELGDRDLLRRLDICDQLLQMNHKHPFLRNLVTGHEKWIVYRNIKRGRHWARPGIAPQTVAKDGLHPKKVMLSIWWDFKGVIYYELLPEGETINTERYCEQLDNLKAAVFLKRPELANRRGVTFLHDNARPHVSLDTRRKLLDFSWNFLPHPPYSPDLAPSDFDLFRSLQNSLDGKNFEDIVGIKNHLDRFFAEKPKKFWEQGIFDLPTWWAEVLQQHGAYIDS